MINSWCTCPALALTLLLAGPARGAVAGLEPAAIEQSVEAEMQKAGIPGAAIGVIQGDRLIFSRAFGVASVDTQAPADPRMLFRLGSTTKMLTATALLSLAAKGKVDPNAPIRKHIKELHPRIGSLTLHQLLSHTAGLIDAAVMNGFHDDSALGAGIRQWNTEWLFTQPGVVFSYSNPGYWLAGYLVETVTGKPYADAMAQQVFQPLGMSRSTIRPLVAMTWTLAQGHEDGRVLRPAPDNSANWPAGSAFSSVPEMSRFVIALMNGGRLEGKQALPARVVALMLEPHAKTADPGSSYGYGLYFSERRGVRWAEHTGARAGYASLIRMAPEQRTAVIVLTNTSTKLLPESTDKILEMLLPLDPAEKPRPLTVLPLLPSDLDRYAATYVNGKDRVTIVKRNGKLYLPDGPREWELVKLADWQLGIIDPDTKAPEEAFRFVPDANGVAGHVAYKNSAYRRK